MAGNPDKSNAVPLEDARTAPIAIIAGYGSLPLELANGAIEAGTRPFLVGIEGEAEPAIETFDHAYLAWGQIGTLFRLLKREGIARVVFAGGVKARPDPLKLKLDWGGIKSLPRVLAAMLGGDNTLLSGMIAIFEAEGIEVVGAHEVAPQLLAGDGRIAGKTPSKADRANIELAARACRALGALDIGQAAVAEAGRVVAVEGVEGTDGLIERIVALRSVGRMPPTGKNGVLVKLAKPGQDMRADLPAIGPRTVTRVAQAGLDGIAVDVGRSLILEREETLANARRLGVYIYGYRNSSAAGDPAASS